MRNGFIEELIRKEFCDYKFHITKQIGIKSGLDLYNDNLDPNDRVILADVEGDMKRK